MARIEKLHALFFCFCFLEGGSLHSHRCRGAACGRPGSGPTARTARRSRSSAWRGRGPSGVRRSRTSPGRPAGLGRRRCWHCGSRAPRGRTSARRTFRTRRAAFWFIRSLQWNYKKSPKVHYRGIGMMADVKGSREQAKDSMNAMIRRGQASGG